MTYLLPNATRGVCQYVETASVSRPKGRARAIGCNLDRQWPCQWRWQRQLVVR